ncbi:EFR1 family ferrodoxin [uncultured Pseudodesulfovibrio sp.]|uniref:EFR1 family ferrodoxin n=1 Tax=uncultured Pseudodesulfovibrio sp. TaxID=2035858 RepID=UPI0029C7F681|nr:EFR1 family ferrodoxin [uncultured Pseudodesulfovibrio sp.]
MSCVKLVYFSPTGTTKAVVQRIGSGINPTAVELIDITLPEVRKQPLDLSEDDVLVIGVPVYMGRVPALLSDWLNSIEAHDTPAVCVVVYGNRVYDNSLLELKESVVRRGCIPIAGAAYIGEHSFSEETVPTAHGRPDIEDLRHAEAFGQRIREKLQSVSSLSQLPDLVVPGEHPYGGATELWDVDFIAVSHQCEQCGACAAVCPVGAIDSQDSALIDQVKCITCCACIKKCPQKARSMKPGPVKDAQKRLGSLCQEQKKPECFL